MPLAAITHAKAWIGELFSQSGGSHDAAHTLRVYRTAMKIADTEKACDRDIVALGALLHDADDTKLFGTVGNANARLFMEKEGLSQEMQDRICNVINGVSFSHNRGKVPETLEGKIVQDADRLDAIGAIGIARAFAFGGEHGRALEDTIAHFHEKLLRISGEMQTAYGRHEAAKRHEMMVRFLEAYRKETEE